MGHPDRESGPDESGQGPGRARVEGPIHMSTSDPPREGTEQEDRPRHAELEELPNEALALELEGAKQDLRSAADDVTYALLNEDRAVTDAALGELSDAVHEVRAAVEAATQRVPPEHRKGEE